MESLPFAVGESPFRVKGVAYNNFAAFLDVQLTSGPKTFLDKLHDPALRTFMSQSFLAATWYDAMPMMGLLHELGRELRLPPLQLTRDLARFGIKRDASGIYRLLLKLTSPESLLERSTHTARQYFDFVKSEFIKVADRHYRLSHTGIPAVAAPTYMSLVEGFVEAGLGLAGAKDVRQTWEKPVPAGKAHGVAIVKLQRDITWR